MVYFCYLLLLFCTVQLKLCWNKFRLLTLESHDCRFYKLLTICLKSVLSLSILARHSLPWSQSEVPSPSFNNTILHSFLNKFPFSFVLQFLTGTGIWSAYNYSILNHSNFMPSFSFYNMKTETIYTIYTNKSERKTSLLHHSKYWTSTATSNNNLPRI